MAVPTRITDFNATAASNAPTGSESVGTSLDDYLRGYQAVVRLDLASKGADIASAGTTDLGAVGGLMHDITGTTTITGFGTVAAGVWKIIKFEDALTLTHNATSLILPGGANITTANGDVAIFISEGSGNWRCVSYADTASLTETLTNKTIDLTDNTVTGTVAEFNTAISDGQLGGVLSTSQATTSGTAFGFTSIPSWVKKITIIAQGVSLTGTDDLIVQIGDAGGIESAAYISDTGRFTATTQAIGGSTSSFNITRAGAGSAFSGMMILALANASTNLWVSSHFGTLQGSEVVVGGGHKALSDTLTQVWLGRSGTDTFDAGLVNIIYE